jgi:hypothetical protein
MNVRNAGPAERNHLDGRVELHGAGAEGDHGVGEAHVFLAEFGDVAHHLGLRGDLVELRLLKEVGGSLDLGRERPQLLAEVDVLLWFAGKTREDVREVLQVYQSHFLVEGDLDVFAVHHSDVDLVLQEYVAGLFGIANLDCQGVKRVLALGNG